MQMQKFPFDVQDSHASGDQSEHGAAKQGDAKGGGEVIGG
jgi:hypothetical protein